MLIRSFKLEIRLKVHLGSLLELVGSYKSIHMQTVSFYRFTHSPIGANFRLLLEVLKFEFFLLDKCAIVQCAGQLALLVIRVLANVLAN